MKQQLRRSVVCVLIVTMLNLGFPLIAHADMIGTSTTIELQQRSADLATITAALSRDEARQQLERMGVDSATVDARLAKLTDSELRQLANDIENAPAGGSFLALVGLVFVVLIILEATGAIDMFKKFP